ncbi:unnamed protein product [Macrosiphum euphorbiae]|uniref:Transposable element P transposase n=1 Tax=Macrosiphum euphorbiae TaxID=13131 RepID=A0AAV0WG09_9HEMI|nr:unnamed protein product [Macrosiphum euphorbiae]
MTPNRKYEVSDSCSNIRAPGSLIFENSPSSSSIATPTTKSWVSALIDFPSPMPKMRRIKSPKKSALQQELIGIRKLLKRKRSIISALKQKKTNKKQKSNVNDLFKTFNFPSKNSRSLVSMQLLHKNRKPWSANEKKVALSLYYKSPSTYKYMRRTGIVLPAMSTVTRWLRSINYSTGFSAKYLEQMRLKVLNMDYNEKKCVLLLDEVSIMKTLEYNKILDEIEGFEDLGDMGRTEKLGSHALVIMVRGLYKNWKLPLSYFFTGSGVKGDTLVEIVKNCVKKIVDIGLLPTCIVCDQGTQNRRMFSLLGASQNNPSTEICGKKLFLIYDMPHLIKSLRNNLLSGDFKIGNKVVSINDIKKTYEIDSQSKTARAMTKITPTHLSPNPFQKMSCKLAIQLLSNSVSAAIKTCVATGQLKSNTALHTSEFINVINNMFDSANSKNLYDRNPNRRPLSPKNSIVFENLKKAQALFKEAVKVCHKTKKISTPPCFIGIIWTTTAILELYEQEKVDMQIYRPNKDNFLMTNRLTQDILENLFSVIRQKNGYNRNPTARTFRCCFGHICTYSLMKCLTTCCNNCESDDDEFITVEVLKDVPVENLILSENGELSNENYVHETTDSDNSSKSNEGIYEVDLSLETCSITYFSGYLAKKCFDKFNCANCNLIKPNEHLADKKELLIIHKVFDHVQQSQGLKAPSDELTQIVTICLNIFKNTFPKIKSSKQILKQLLHKAERQINNHFLVLQNSCKDHYEFILQLLFRTRIYKECKWINANLGKRGYQNAAKLRIFENK